MGSGQCILSVRCTPFFGKALVFVWLGYVMCVLSCCTIVIFVYRLSVAVQEGIQWCKGMSMREMERRKFSIIVASLQ